MYYMCILTTLNAPSSHVTTRATTMKTYTYNHVSHNAYAYVSKLEQFALLLRKQPPGASELQHPSTRGMHTCASTWRHTPAGSLSWRSACVIVHSLLSQPYHLRFILKPDMPPASSLSSILGSERMISRSKGTRSSTRTHSSKRTHFSTKPQSS